MADYVKATNFTAKDSLPSGNSGKIVKGTEIDTELTAIASAIASKANINSPTFTGTPAAPTATTGSNTTQIATTAYVKQEIDAEGLGTIATQDSDDVSITGGSITGITDLTVADGGTGASSITANSVILGNGSSALSGNLVAPGTSGNVLTSNGTTWTSAAPATVRGLGLGGETWHNVAGSRSANTTYTNNYSYPIMVNILLHTGSAGTNPSYIYVDGTVTAKATGGGWTGGMDSTGSVIVPPGSTYSTNSSACGDLWMELY